MIRRVVFSVLRSLKWNKANVSVHLIGEKKMGAFNRGYHGSDKPTDGLSFSSGEGTKLLPGEEGGDLFLCPVYIKKQAKRFGVPYRQEFFRVLIHGLLHLRGYDHTTKSAAQRMFELQERLVTDGSGRQQI